jgi:hypothetical protein
MARRNRAPKQQATAEPGNRSTGEEIPSHEPQETYEPQGARQAIKRIPSSRFHRAVRHAETKSSSSKHHHLRQTRVGSPFPAHTFGDTEQARKRLHQEPKQV